MRAKCHAHLILLISLHRNSNIWRLTM